MAIAKTAPVIKYSFPPFVPDRARLIILGTLPGEESLRLQQYYAHPRNHFWPLIGALSERPLPATFPARVALLKNIRWAIWDVLEGAERIGSSDAAIRNPAANGFGAFFAAHPDLRTVAFNGQKAHELFRRYVVKTGIVDPVDFNLIELPSSSPLYTIPFEEKLAVWRAKLGAYLPVDRQKRRAK